jgi:uncharacterized protein (DUF427 family)
MRTRGRVRVEPGPKRIRALLGDSWVADTTAVRLVWEKPYYPTYYLPVADVAADLVPTGATEQSPSRGEGVVLDVKTHDRVADGAALRYPGSPIEELRDLVRIEWAAMDAWFEEDEEVFVHPRDPYRRVDVLTSSRPVRIEIDGVVLAESTRPTMLFETGLPRRSYLPKVDVRWEHLEPTDHRTSCPYKGTARYWDVVVGGKRYENLAWSYPTPLPESAGVRGLVAFYDEKVDVVVDGRHEDRPRTPFS